MNLRKLLEDQRAFNQLIFKRDLDQDKFIARVKELSVGMIEETLEFLKTFQFKVHRRQKLRLQNVAHSHEELIDMFKYWLSLVDVTDFPLNDLEEMYYAKSRVVQYRYQEEWMKTLTGPSVVVDIDNVIADYIAGICDWGIKWGPSVLGLQYEHPDGYRLMKRLEEIKKDHLWVNAETVGVPHMEWQKVKHSFRTEGGKRQIPPFDDAQAFLWWCHNKGWNIILCTSRPIAEYPNVFTDTLSWLHQHDMPFDYLWWTMEKGERLAEADINFDDVVFAVDDSYRYVEQMHLKGVQKVFWVVREPETDRHREILPPGITIVHSLTELMTEMESHHVVCRREA